MYYVIVRTQFAHLMKNAPLVESTFHMFAQGIHNFYFMQSRAFPLAKLMILNSEKRLIYTTTKLN